MTGWPWTVTTLPFAWATTSSIVAAMPSTTPSDTASTAEDERASLTVDAAQSTGRPRVSAIDRMKAIASFLTFSPSVPGMSWPFASIGEAAPMRVPGRHVRQVRREGDERPGAGREPARRGDPDDDRDGRLEDRRHDVHRRVEAGRRACSA